MTTYAGEFDASSIDRSAVGFGLSNSLTYQLSQSFGIGMGHTLAFHPRIPDTSRRHNLQAFFIAQHPRQRVTPFFKLGASNTIGGEVPGFGPHLGFGLNIISSGTFSLFQETTFNLVFPGRAIDGQDLSGGFDALGTVGVGIKITDLGGFFGTRNIGLEEIFSSAEISNYLVRPGESVRFSSGAKDESNVDFNWSFGDGFEDSGKSVAHVFEQSGLYEVKLSAQNAGVSEVKTIYISVQEEPTIAIASNAVDQAGTPDLLTSGVNTIDGPVREVQPFSYSSQIESPQEKELIEEETESAKMSEAFAEQVEVEDPAKPKRTRVIILDGVRIEEEIPEDELPQEEKVVAVINPIETEVPSEIPDDSPAEETLPTDPEDTELADPISDPEIIVETVAEEMVAETDAEDQTIDINSDEPENNSESSETSDTPEKTDEAVEEPITVSVVDTVEVETTTIIVDGEEIEVATSSLEEDESKEESNSDTIIEDAETITDTSSPQIDREELEEGVYTWVLAIFETSGEAVAAAKQLGADSFIVEMRPEYEMFSIFGFHTKDRSARINYLTTYGSFETKEDAINAMNDIPAEFQARPFMMEIRRF